MINLNLKRDEYINRANQIRNRLSKDIDNKKYPIIYNFNNFLIVLESSPIPIKLDHTIFNIILEYHNRDDLIIDNMVFNKMEFHHYLHMRKMNLLRLINFPQINLIMDDEDSIKEIPLNIYSLSFHGWDYNIFNHNLYSLSLCNCDIKTFTFSFPNLHDLDLSCNYKMARFEINKVNYSLKELDLSNTLMKYNNLHFFRVLEKVDIDYHSLDEMSVYKFSKTDSIKVLKINKFTKFITPIKTSFISKNINHIGLNLDVELFDDLDQVNTLELYSCVCSKFYCKHVNDLSIRAYVINLSNVEYYNNLKKLELRFRVEYDMFGEFNGKEQLVNELKNKALLENETNFDLILKYVNLEFLKLYFPPLSSDFSFKPLNRLTYLLIECNHVYTENSFEGLYLLEYLELDTGEIQNKAFKDLTKLTILKLEKINMFPDDLIHSLKLKEFRFKSSNVKILPYDFLKGQYQIEKLEIINNWRLTLLPSFSDLISLTNLNLKCNCLTSLRDDALDNLINLTNLNLLGNEFNRSIIFPKNNFIRSFSIRGNIRVISRINNLPLLTYIKLISNDANLYSRIVVDNHIALNEDIFKNIPNLETCIMTGRFIIDTNIFKYFKHLRYLYLHCYIPNVEVIKGLDKLDILQIDNRSRYREYYLDEDELKKDSNIILDNNCKNMSKFKYKADYL